MFFNLTTMEGFLKALTALNRWGVDAFREWAWMIEPHMTRPASVKGTLPLMPPGGPASAEKKYLEIQRTVATELIKSGILNNVGRTEIAVSENAVPDLAGIEAVTHKMDHYAGRVVYEIAGVPIEISKSLSGTISMTMTLSHSVDAASSTAVLCPYCSSEKWATMLNGDFKCRRCRREFSAVQVRDYFRDRLDEAERRTRPDLCGSCGRSLSDPKWCAWCGSEPGRSDVEAGVMDDFRERISAIEKIIQAGEPDLYRQARAGDQNAISQAYDSACKEGQWKPLVGLGVAAVDFLITKFKDARAHEAASALIEIGHASAVPVLIEGLRIGEYERELHKIILTGLGGPLEGHASVSYERLLKKLEELSLSDARQSVEISISLQFQIVSLLVNILGFAASEVSADALAASVEMQDIPVRLVQTDFSTIISEGEDAYGRLEHYGKKYVTEQVDCSALRGAARRELKRRALF